MPELTELQKEKIEDLRVMSDSFTEPIEVYQIVRIAWEDGDIFYASSNIAKVADLPEEIEQVEARLIAHDFPAHFLPITMTDAMSDSEIDLEMWDGDGTFADMVEANGEGTPCEVFFWIPAVELLISVWTGHLRTDEDSDAITWRGKIANGFRSPDLPLPGRAHYRECQAIYGKLLDNQTAIDQNGCPHNAHLPGGTIGNNLHETCPQLTPADCTARGINPLMHLSHRSAEVLVINNQTSGSRLYSIARGNETNLKRPVRVIMGTRYVRDMEILAFRRDFNNNNPGHGWFGGIYEVCEGPIMSISQVVVHVGTGSKPAEPQHYAHRLGLQGQTPVSNLTTHGYSNTAVIHYLYGWVNPADVEPNSCRSEGMISGLTDIRIYSNDTTFSVGYTRDRAWQILHALTNKRWGFGLDHDRCSIASFRECVAFGKMVTFTDPQGTAWSYRRGYSDIELAERSAQQQIEDMCLAGRLSRPFQFQGKLHVVPLRAATDEELENAPVFTDTGDDRNISVDSDGLSSLTRSRKSDLDMPNRIEATFDDATQKNMEQPAKPAEDIEQQLRAGRMMGDNSRRKVVKKYAFAGVTNEAHAVAMEHYILWFGEFDEGGIKNNLEVKFRVWWIDALELHESKIIKVVSEQLERYEFEYFRIKNIEWSSNLHVEITAQAYNHEAVLAFEPDPETPPPGPGPPEVPPPLPTPPGTPCRVTIHHIQYGVGTLTVGIDQCTEPPPIFI